VCAAGDAWAPATIAAAVWAGHRYAEELDEPTEERPVPFRREVTELSSEVGVFLPITPVEPARSR
jgi:dimethylamine/trimethylamine dehydrogenase